MVNRHRVLLSAYACEPNKGSEPGVGWNWAQHLSKYFEVYVITRKNNEQIINDYLVKQPNEHLHFIFHDCSRIACKMKKLPNGIFLYYKQWQKEIFPIVERIVKEEKIELVHHITFNEFRTPGKLYSLNVPFIWGPIGGGQFYNSVFRQAYFRKIDIIKERIRNIINLFNIKFSRDIKKAVDTASVILIADQSTEKIMPKTRNYIRLLETAYNTDRNRVKRFTYKKGDTIKLLWVGGIWPRKGLKMLIDALGNCEFRNFELCIIGDGSDIKLNKKLVNKYGLADKVNFLGSLPYNEVNKHYDDADLFIFTSLRDTSGNVVLEAMSHGLPIIALNHHGVGEIVTNQMGFIIEITDYETICDSIVNSITYYYENPDEILRHGIQSRKRLENVYSWDISENIMEKIYIDVLEDKTNEKVGS